MEQSLEMMRKRHAYFTKLIEEHNIHTAREFCDKLGEMFTMLGVETDYSDDHTGYISISCEGYDYEDYTIIDGVDGALATISNTVMWNDPRYCCNDVVDIFEQEPPQSEYVTSGFPSVDALIGGWKKSSVTLLAGRPRMGKTSLCITMAMNIARQGIPVAIFSLGQSAEQIVHKISVTGCNITYNKLEEYITTVETRAAGLKGLPIYIDDTTAITPHEIERKVIRLTLKHGIRIIFIDYLELMSSDRKFDTREEEIKNILNDLELMALRKSIPVVIMSQFNKWTSEKDGPRCPDLSLLRDYTQSIPKTIGFLYRPDLYCPDFYRRDKPQKSEETVDLIIEKSPSGKTGTIPLKFYPNLCKFVDAESITK